MILSAALDMFKFENSTIVLASSSDSENIDEENLPNKEENKKLPALFQRILIQAEDLTVACSAREKTYAHLCLKLSRNGTNLRNTLLPA